MRVPGGMLFSATSVGELKNTIESRNAPSTNAAAIASTPRLVPIKTRRLCLRVISAFKPQTFDHFLYATELVRVTGERSLCVGGGLMGLVAFAQYHIGAQEPLPSFDIATILFQPSGEPRHHAADHLVAVLFAHRTGSGHILATRPRRSGLGRTDPHARQSVAHHWQPRRSGRSGVNH